MEADDQRNELMHLMQDHAQPFSVASCRPKQKASLGIALITSLILLVVVTLLAVSMLRSLGIQEKIAGTTMEKQRSFQAAQSALQYGEWWIGQGNGGSPITCGTVVNGNVATNMRSCSNALSNPASLPWTGGYTTYTPPQMTVVSGGGGLASTGDINYASQPELYIYSMGQDSTGQYQLYQVTAVGFGGSGVSSSGSTTTVQSASVVQSTYAWHTAVKSLDTP